jgi:hypothetical protein
MILNAIILQDRLSFSLVWFQSRHSYEFRFGGEPIGAFFMVKSRTAYLERKKGLTFPLAPLIFSVGLNYRLKHVPDPEGTSPAVDHVTLDVEEEMVANQILQPHEDTDPLLLLQATRVIIFYLTVGFNKF